MTGGLHAIEIGQPEKPNGLNRKLRQDKRSTRSIELPET